MSNQINGRANDRKKTIIVYFLYLGASFIIFLGFFFSAYSVRNNISIQVLNSSVPGIVFRLLVAYLGIRYYLMVNDFKIKLYKSTEEFSWSNFKKEKRKLV